jgi:ABC-type proline/glycine betaine transport system permease subunit
MYRRVMRWALHDRSAEARTRRNSMTSPILWLLCMVSIIPAMLWWDDSTLIALSLVVFAFVYIGLYWRIVRFRSPRVLHMLRPREHSPRAGQGRRS